MSKYIAKVGQWETPTETSGSIQNTSTNITIEVTSNGQSNEGLTLSPMQIINFDGTVYVRSAGKKDATFTVVPFKIAAGGGGSSGGGGSTYTLPTASSSIKGGIKIGDRLSISSEKLSADIQIADYASGKQYKVGDLVVYDKKFQKCTTTHTSTNNFDSSKFMALNADIASYSANVSYTNGNLVIYNGSIYECNTPHTSTTTFDQTKWTKLTADSVNVLNDFKANTNYKKNELVYYAGSIYRSKSDHTSATSFQADSANFELLHSDIKFWASGVYYTVGVTVIEGTKMYVCKTAHMSSTTFNESNWTLIAGNSDSYAILDWKTAKEYKKDNVVTYGGTIYRANADHTSSTFSSDASNWDILSSDIESWQSSIYYKVGCVVIYDSVMYVCNTSHTSSTTFDDTKFDKIGGESGHLLLDWKPSTKYSVNAIVQYNGSLFRCKTAHTSDSSSFSTDNSNWAIITSDLKDWQSSTYYNSDVVVIYNDKLYKCSTSHTSGTTFDTAEEANWSKLCDASGIISEWKPSIAYSARDIVVYSGDLYECVNAHTSASTFSSDEEHNWVVVGRSTITDWMPDYLYAVDDIVVYADSVYRCVAQHISDSSDFENDVSKWQLVYTDLKVWKPSTYFSVGNCVINGKKLYRCKTAHTSGLLFDSTEEANWEQIGGGSSSLTMWATSKEYAVGDIVMFANSLYRCTVAHTSSSFIVDLANWDIVCADIKFWSSGNYYSVGVTVIANNKLYYCKVAHTSGTTFDSSEKANWTEVESSFNIDNWVSGESYIVGDFVLHNDIIYKCITANSDTSFTPTKWQRIGGINDWQTGLNYYVGDLAIYNNILYQCTTANNDTTFTLANWQAISASTSGSAGGTGYVKTLWEGGLSAVGDTATLSESRKNFDLLLLSLVNGDLVTQTIALLPTDNKFTLHNFNSSGTQFTFYSGEFTSDTVISLRSVVYTEGWKFGRVQGVKFGGEHAHIADWKTGTDYSVDMVVRYGNSLYRCNTAHTSSTFSTDISNWELLYADLKDWQASIYYEVGTTVISDNKIYRCKTAHTSGTTFADTNWNLLAGGGSGAEDWETSKKYKVGDIVIRENNLYKCITAHTSNAFATDITNWQKLDNIPDWKASTAYFVGDYLYYDSNLYRVIKNHTSGTTFDDTDLEMLGGTPLDSDEVKAIIDAFTPSGNVLNGAVCLYTTAERAVGMWINGKTVYQKTYSGTLPAVADTNTNIFEDNSLANVDTVVSIEGVIDYSDDSYQIDETLHADRGYSTRIWVSRVNKSIRGSVGSVLVGAPLHVTIRYTKV